MTNQSTPIIKQYVALIVLEKLDNSFDSIEQIAQKLIIGLDLHVVNEMSHSFDPEGITLAYILSESHLLIHTWPEMGIIHIDLVTCSYKSKEDFENSLNKALSEKNIKSLEIKAVDF